MPKLLITGASGFIGGYLVEAGIQKGYNVFAGIRKSSNKIYLQDERINFLEMNFEDKDQLHADLAEHKFDYVIHAAGATAAKNQEAYNKINAEYVKNLVEGIKKSGKTPHKFLFLSSLASYGPADNIEEGIVHEKATPNPVTQYGISKLEAEKFLIQQRDIPISVLRPTAVFGPRDKDLFQVFQLLSKRLELYIGSNPQNLSFIYIKDLVRIVMDVMELEGSRFSYFVTDGKSYTTEEFNSIIKSKLGNRTLSLRLPIGLVQILATTMEGISKVTGKYPALNRDKLNELKSLNWECDISPLKEDINFEPEYTLEQAVEETVQWYKENKWI
jgi:nucleoside-diphosphate-sugar epimerase